MNQQRKRRRSFQRMAVIVRTPGDNSSVTLISRQNGHFARICTRESQFTARNRLRKPPAWTPTNDLSNYRQMRFWNKTENAQLTSLKRFQCLILRLYWEMVDSHCSSSMKFPAFPASFALFTSTWREKPASRHREATRRAATMLAEQFQFRLGWICCRCCCC